MCGIQPVWASEVEPYPITVTRSRFPTMKHLGDISKINGAEVEPVDVISFGSPCQDLSVAGKRAGLEGARSGLFMEAVRIIKEMRKATDGKYPRFALWENVPGAFSSNKGEDFRVVLEELIKIVEPTAVMPAVPKKGWAYADSYVGDGWSIAYRVFDTQYWPRTPQRRRRIYLVADFRGQCAREILFEREGLRGYLTESPPPRERVTAYVEDGIGAANREGNCVSVLNPWDSQGNQVQDGTGCNVYPTLRGCGGAGYQAGYVLANHGDVKTWDARGNGNGETVSTITGDHENRVTDYSSLVVYNGENITHPLNKTNPQPGDPCHTLGTDSRNYLVQAYGISNYDSSAMKSANPHSGIYEAETSRTLDLNGGNPACNQGGIAIVESVGIDTYNGSVTGETAATLGVNCGMSTGRNGVVQTHLIDSVGGQSERGWEGNIAPTLKATHYKCPPVISHAAGFCTEHSAKAGGVGFQEETAPTLRAGVIPAMVGKAQLASGAEVAGCLMASVYDKLGAQEMFSGDYTVIETHAAEAMTVHGEEISGTLMARDYKGTGRWDAVDKVVCQQEVAGVDCRNMNEYPDLYPTLQAKPNGGQSLNFSGAVRDRYIVRRLTPTECARLQGFPDQWGHPDRKESFSDEEYKFWLEVRNTHAAINGKAVKEYTKAQMEKWYNKLHSDSAEYKMWGNGIALPTALYVMQGIAAIGERK